MLLGRIDEQIGRRFNTAKIWRGTEIGGCVASRQAAAQPASHEGGLEEKLRTFEQAPRT